jgi:general stress protein YciG
VNSRRQASDPSPGDGDEDDQEPDEAPETPPDEPPPVPVQDPPPDEAPRIPYVVSRVFSGQETRRKAVSESGRKERRGFASMSPEKQREIASKGGRAAHQKGTAHEWTSDEARTAGRKGGQVSRGGRGRLPDGMPTQAMVAGSASSVATGESK